MKNLFYGAAYYQEYLPTQRTDEDFRLMKEANMNVIRIAESTWSTYEPVEGHFDFQSVKDVLERAEKFGLDVIIGTPSYAIPAWLEKMYPDIMVDTHTGRRRYGARQIMDITHPKYLFYVERVIRKLLDLTSKYRCVIGYQIDNETKHYDTCSALVQERFIQTLKERFVTVGALNDAFGLNYWSNRIGRWEDFPDIRGTINGSLGAAFSAFQRSLVTEFLAWQAGIVKEYLKDEQFITHNFDFEWRGISYGVQPDVNHKEASKALTLTGCDIYHPSQNDLTGREISFGGDIARCLKHEKYLVLETEAQGFPQWTPYPDQLYLQAMAHLASGARGIMYWHWHSLHNAFETYWKGVLSHDLMPNRIYRESSKIGKMMKTLSGVLDDATMQNKAAILVSNESLTGMDWFKLPDGKRYNDVFRFMYDACYDMNLQVDVIFPGEDFSKFKLLLVPSLYSASDLLCEQISEFAVNGGRVIAGFKSGFCDENLKVRHTSQPGGLSELFGVTYQEFCLPQPGTTLDDGGAVTSFMELLQPNGAKAVHTYVHPGFGGVAAVTTNQYGSGGGTYLGCLCSQSTLQSLIKKELVAAGITNESLNYHFPLIAKEQRGKNGRVIFLMNFSLENQRTSWNYTDAWDYSSEEAIVQKAKIKNGETIALTPWQAIIALIPE